MEEKTQRPIGKIQSLDGVPTQQPFREHIPMTLREHYAGLFGAALSPNMLAEPCARRAVEYADALIAELSN